MRQLSADSSQQQMWKTFLTTPHSVSIIKHDCSAVYRNNCEKCAQQYKRRPKKPVPLSPSIGGQPERAHGLVVLCSITLRSSFQPFVRDLPHSSPHGSSGSLCRWFFKLRAKCLIPEEGVLPEVKSLLTSVNRIQLNKSFDNQILIK